MTTSAAAPGFRIIVAVMRIDLIKYQALGNDYLGLDLPGPLDQLVPLLPTLCDRHRGLGSDGLLAFDPAAIAGRIFNPDGSEARESANVQLFEVIDRARIRIEIWERGAGYTLASGTSASAVAAACMRAGFVDDQVTIQMPGGDLQVRKEKSGNLVQSGPARRVYRASIDLADF